MNDFPIIVSISNEYFDDEGNLVIDKPINEAMKKPNRPYLEGTLVADSDNTYFVPFRSHINETFARANPDAVVHLPTLGKPHAGLDISKTIVVNNNIDFHVNRSGIATDQYMELKHKRPELINKLGHYVEGYKQAIRKGEKLPTAYRYTTLKNFHEELGLPPYQESKREKQNELTNDELERRREFARRNRGLGR